MRHLAAWSRRRIQVLWLAWLGLLVGLFVLDLGRQWQSQKLAAPKSAALANGGTPFVRAPEQHTDLVYSVVADDVAVLKTVMILFGPPGILTALWLYARHRRHPEPPTAM